MSAKRVFPCRFSPSGRVISSCNALFFFLIAFYFFFLQYKVAFGVSVRLCRKKL